MGTEVAVLLEVVALVTALDADKHKGAGEIMCLSFMIFTISASAKCCV